MLARITHGVSKMVAATCSIVSHPALVPPGYALTQRLTSYTISSTEKHSNTIVLFFRHLQNYFQIGLDLYTSHKWVTFISHAK